MNLKEIVNYRPKCFIHDLPMQPYPIGREGDRMRLTDVAVELLVHHRQDISGKPSLRGIVFNYDGTYFKTSVCPKYAEAQVFKFYMMCSTCEKTPIYKQRSPGLTTIDNMLSKHHSFIVNVMGDSEHNFDCHISEEIIKFHINDRFYHVTTDLLDKQTSIRIGHCEPFRKIGEVIDSVTQLAVPAINMNSIENIDQLLNKIKLYNLFS